jgi:hypothetical protein
VARGQRAEGTIDLGAMALRYADTVNTGAGVLSAHGLVNWERADADAYVTVSQFTSGGWSSQGSVSGSFFSAPVRRTLFELAGFAGGSVHQDGARTGQVIANLRLHTMRDWGDFFVGAGTGRTSFGGSSNNMVLGEVGVSARLRSMDAAFVVSPVAIDTLRYADNQLTLFWARRTIDVQALLGFRAGDQLTELGATARTWGSVSAVAWLRPNIAAVLSGGTYPIDPTQGFPGGRFFSVSIRLARGVERRLRSAGETIAPATVSTEDTPAVERFNWQRSGAHHVTLTVSAPRAVTVDVTGDFTNWSPVTLASSGNGSWTLTLPMEPGRYQMNLRINDGKWIVPPGLLAMSDEFGGTVGLLIIE